MEAIRLKIIAPPIGYFSEKNGECGFYEPDERKIYINCYPGKHTYFMDLIDTVIHETRHKYQYDIMEHPERFDAIPNFIRNYLYYSEYTYPKEIRTAEQNEAYKKNGLEIDVKNYTRERVQVYEKYTFQQLEDMWHAPEHDQINNQILMGSGDLSPSGIPAPFTVGELFDNNRFKEEYFNTYKSIGNDNQGGGCDMNGKISTNMSTSAQSEMLSFYSDVIVEIQNKTKKTVDELKNQLRMHPYYQLQEVVNIFIRYYNSDLPEAVKKAIYEWQESEASLVASTKRLGAGDAAIEVAHHMEEGLLSAISSSFKSVDESNNSTGEMNVNEERILECARIVKSYCKELESNKADTLLRLRRQKQDNSIYANIETLVINSFKYTLSAANGAAAAFESLAAEFSINMDHIVSSSETEAGKAEGRVIDLKSFFENKRKNL